MSLSQEVEVDRIFARALELKARARATYLRQACDGRPELRAAVDELLSLSNTRDDLLDSAGEHRPYWLGAAEEALEAGLQGRLIGPWRVVRELGRGGMGLVYLAERDSKELTQRVALKLVQVGSNRARLQRFTQEGQILADLDHPGIARLLDGGVSEEGWPYLAMEYVDGQPIDAMCDRHDLSIRRRLELFEEVCATVAAAHRQLVVHRDLKPSNILVADTNGQHRIKLLDFGIAKLLKEGNTPDPTFTADGGRVMTPSYASPEQFRGEAIGVASDVYQLGLLLYRLLTGRLPYEVHSASPTRAEEVICRTPPPRASSMVLEATDTGAGPGVGDVNSWRRSLRGDLDTILAKALRKDPAQRYLSAAALAADVRRHLDGLPIEARPPSWPYLTKKFVGRHRWRLAIALVVALLGVTQTIVYTTRLRAERDRAEAARLEAEQARDASQELSRFLVDLFEINDPERSPDAPVDALELMERATERLDAELDPLIRARLLHSSGEIYTKLAHFERATRLVEEALDIRQRHLPAGAPDRLESLGQLGIIYSRLSRFEEAGTLLDQVLEARRAAGEAEPLAMALNNLGNLRLRERRLAEAETFHREALELRERALPPDHPNLTDSINNLGVTLHFRSRNAEAIPYLTRAAELFATHLGPDHPQRAVALNNLALAEIGVGRYPPAGRHLHEAIEIWTESYGPDHPRTLRAVQNLGSVARREGRLEEAAEILNEVLKRQRASVPQEPLEVARTLSLLGVVQTDLGRHEAAAQTLGQGLDTRRKVLGIDHPLTLTVRSNLARLLFLRGQVVEAETAHREILVLKKSAYGPQHSAIAWTLHHLAMTLIAQGRHAEARPLLEHALAIRRTTLGEDHPDTVESHRELMRAAGG